MSKSRLILLGVAAGGIILYTWALFSFQVLLPTLPRIIALICSVIVVVALIAFFAVAAYRTIRNLNGWGWAVATGLSFIASFLAVTFVIDWGVGAAIRSLSVWSWLPKGNLFEAGGRAGWTYLVLFVLLAITAVWGNVNRLSELRPSKPSFKRPKLHGSSLRPSREDSHDGVQQMNDMFS
jgi:hypothetical protein